MKLTACPKVQRDVVACKQGSQVPEPKLLATKSYNLSSESCHSPLSLNISNWRMHPSTLSSGSLVSCQVSLGVLLFLVGQVAKGMLALPSMNSTFLSLAHVLYSLLPLQPPSMFFSIEFSWFCLVYPM